MLMLLKSFKSSIKYFVLFINFFVLCSCSNFSEQRKEQIIHHNSNLTYRPLFIQNHVDAMSDSLVAHSQKNFKSGRIAIGSITMIDTFKINKDLTHPLHMLGNQIQESLMTSLLQRGYHVVEYRRSKDIGIHNNFDQMLTRELDKLNDTDEFSYFLTGTVKYQENGAAVNLRVIDLLNNEVVSATTKFIPLDVFWDNRQVNSINGMLYRNSYRSKQQ